MKKTCYIADLRLCFDSEIDFEFGPSGEEFTHPVLPVTVEYQINIRLCDRIVLPAGEPIRSQTVRIWPSGDIETRVYPYWSFSDAAILSTLDGNHITIQIDRSVWHVHMQSFRPWSYIHLEQLLLRHDALILHSASILYGGKAILFSAPSETGKTTQALIWHRRRPETTDLNGDRTVLKYTGEGWYACGIPISGTSLLSHQAAAPIACVAMVHRAPADSVSALSPVRKLGLLYEQVTVLSADNRSTERTMDLLERFIAIETVLQLNCTMNDTACDVLYATLFGA